jgi:hypothetical protein
MAVEAVERPTADEGVVVEVWYRLQPLDPMDASGPACGRLKVLCLVLVISDNA